MTSEKRSTAQRNDPALDRLVADLEAIRADHLDEDSSREGCYGLGGNVLCPVCSALKRFKEATLPSAAGGRDER